MLICRVQYDSWYSWRNRHATTYFYLEETALSAALYSVEWRWEVPDEYANGLDVLICEAAI